MNSMMRHQSLRMIVCALAGVSLAFAVLWRHTSAQSGALIPVSVKNQPDSSILSLQVMKVDVAIDNQQDDERGGTSAFSARVFPIPAYGSKRVELEYTETPLIENLASHFSFPLRPSFSQPQRVGELRINVQALSDSPISPSNSPACSTWPRRLNRSAFSAAMLAAGCMKKWR